MLEMHRKPGTRLTASGTRFDFRKVCHRPSYLSGMHALVSNLKKCITWAHVKLNESAGKPDKATAELRATLGYAERTLEMVVNRKVKISEPDQEDMLRDAATALYRALRVVR